MADTINRPYTKILEQDVRVTEIEDEDLFTKEHERIENYIEFWKMYKGDHWDDTELEEDIPTIVFNKARTLTNKSVSFLVGKPFTFNYTDETVEKLLAPFIRIILENSGGIEMFGPEAVQMGSVSGDCFIKPVYDAKKGIVYLQVKDSKDVAVRYTFIDYKNTIPDEAQIRWKYLDPADDTVKEKREVWTKTTRTVFIDGKKIAKESGDNFLGVVPLVHIRNFSVGKEVYGSSDISQFEVLNKLLNYAVRKFYNVVDYHGDPVTLVYGARASEMEKGDNKMWSNLPVDAKVENLSLNTDLGAQQKMIEYIVDAIHEQGCVPEDSVTGNAHISNTSGVALYMNNLPINELTERKKGPYGRGFRAAVMLALELMVKVETQLVEYYRLEENMDFNEIVMQPWYSGIIVAANELTKYYRSNQDPYIRKLPWNDVNVQFQSFIPKDKAAQLQEISQEMALRLESRKGAMRRLGKDNIEGLMKEIDQDLVDMANMELQTLYGQPQFPKPKTDVSEGMSQLGPQAGKAE